MCSAYDLPFFLSFFLSFFYFRSFFRSCLSNEYNGDLMSMRKDFQGVSKKVGIHFEELGGWNIYACVVKAQGSTHCGQTRWPRWG